MMSASVLVFSTVQEMFNTAFSVNEIKCSKKKFIRDEESQFFDGLIGHWEKWMGTAISSDYKRDFVPLSGCIEDNNVSRIILISFDIFHSTSVAGTTVSAYVPTP